MVLFLFKDNMNCSDPGGIVMAFHRTRPGGWNREPRNKPMHLQTAVLTKVLRTHNRERTITSVNAAAKTVQLYKMKTDPCLSPDTNIRSKYMKGLNVGSQTAKLLEESMEACMKFHYIGLDYDGFGYDLAYTASFFWVWRNKSKNRKWDYIRI